MVAGNLFVFAREEADLPHLPGVHGTAERRHSAQPDAVCDFPVSYSRQIVGKAFIFEEFRLLYLIAFRV